MSNLNKLIESTPAIRHNVLRRLRQVIAVIIVTALLLFISAGSLKWLYAWLYMAFYVLTNLIGFFLVSLEVLAERGSIKEHVEKWDPLLSGIIQLTWMGVYLAAGLDFRWRWTPPLATGVHIGAILIFLLGCILTLWAMNANCFYSSTVRLQFDRGHNVCSSGPYRYIRHPGYLGMIIYGLASPLILGSLWAMLPMSVVIGLVLVRTGLEDKTLHQKLPGYREYANRVRYRLVPGIW